MVLVSMVGLLAPSGNAGAASGVCEVRGGPGLSDAVRSCVVTAAGELGLVVGEALINTGGSPEEDAPQGTLVLSGPSGVIGSWSGTVSEQVALESGTDYTLAIIGVGFGSLSTGMSDDDTDFAAAQGSTPGGLALAVDLEDAQNQAACEMDVPKPSPAVGQFGTYGVKFSADLTCAGLLDMPVEAVIEAHLYKGPKVGSMPNESAYADCQVVNCVRRTSAGDTYVCASSCAITWTVEGIFTLTLSGATTIWANYDHDACYTDTAPVVITCTFVSTGSIGTQIH